ncbi:unnamed protein product [Clonostachys chloroleuca]|uniref:Uncharacterized protein n=1 Tax=Clonostachys chloroleuca TaxID=1926264 RepID=A0AA35Q7I7_9HYPO|nr:unnamed protein product [Clonostachys chloroleuca]
MGHDLLAQGRQAAGVTQAVDHRRRRVWQRLAGSSELIHEPEPDDKEVISVEKLGRLAREASEKQHLEKERRWKRVQMSAPNNATGTATIEENQGDAKKPSAELTDSELDAVELDTEAMRLFRRIWPRPENSKGWREEWASFPLHI